MKGRRALRPTGHQAGSAGFLEAGWVLIARLPWPVCLQDKGERPSPGCAGAK